MTETTQPHELLTQMLFSQEPCALYCLQAKSDVFCGPNKFGKLFCLIAEDHLTSNSNGVLEPNLTSLKTNRLLFD